MRCCCSGNVARRPGDLDCLAFSLLPSSRWNHLVPTVRPACEVQGKHTVLKWQRIDDHASIILLPRNIDIEDQGHLHSLIRKVDPWKLQSASGGIRKLQCRHLPALIPIN